MIYRNDSISVIPFHYGTLLYSVLSGTLVYLDKTVTRNESHLLADAVAEIKEASQHSENHFSPIIRSADAPLSPPFLGIIPTRGCNLQCRYCAFETQSAHTINMDLELALASIEWFAKLCINEKRTSLDVEFFGGEPMMQPDLVHSVALKTKRIANDLGISSRLRIITNGVYPISSAQMLADLFDKVILSIDGPEDIHNSYRPYRPGKGTYKQVDQTARIISEGQSELSLRACITQNSAARMPEIAKHFVTQFSPDEISFEPLSPNSRCDGEKLKPPEATEFVSGFFASQEVAQDYDVLLVHATAQLDRKSESFCPVGRDGFILSPDGAVSACYLNPTEWREKGLALDYGHINMKMDFKYDSDRVAAMRALVVQNKLRCRDCFAKWHCCGGCHVNHTYPGCSTSRDSLCQITRMILFRRLLETLGLTEDPTIDEMAPYDPNDWIFEG